MAEAIDRLKRFREYIAKLDPVGGMRGDARAALYVDPPGRTLASELELRVKLAPGSLQLVVGSVGGGKTTQLLRARDSLNETPDIHAAYVDVSRYHDIDQDLDGILLLLAGKAVSKLVATNSETSVKEAVEQFRAWADGRSIFVPYDEGPDDDSDWEPEDREPGELVFVPGALRPPLPPLKDQTKHRLEVLRTLVGALGAGEHMVVLFDSLDRLTDVERFRRLATDDIRALQTAGIGVVVVGPSRVVYTGNRHVVDLFDQLHVQPAFDVANDADSRGFLEQVLTRRADETVLPAASRKALVKWSGGVLRDLLGLAKTAVEETFLAGADAVTAEHVLTAADRFGRSLMVGLNLEEIEKLQGLRRGRKFVVTNDEDLALLESRRILEYRGVVTRHAVHPAIAPLLAGLEGRR